MKKPDILIVEDTIIYSKIAADIFSKEYNVHVAEDGLKAIEILESGVHISVILLDLVMPHMSGFEFMEYIKEKPKYASIPIILTTSEGEDRNVLRALELGAIDFISKPYNPEIVRRKVENVLAQVVMENEKLRDDLDETTTHLRAIEDAMPGGIVTYEMTDRLCAVCYNDGYCQLLGYTREEYEAQAIFTNALDSIHPEDIQDFLEKIKNAIKTGAATEINCRVKHKSGGYKNLHISAKPSLEGSKIRCNAVMIDVTKEIKAVNNFKMVAEDLRYQSRHDALTGIYNQNTFFSEAERLIRHNEDTDFVVVYFDIEKFKVINDLIGVDKADYILKNIAKSMSEYVKGIGKAVCGRIHSDRFVYCIPEKDLKLSELVSDRMIEDSLISFKYRFTIKYGIYYVKDRSLSAMHMCDRAAMATNSIKGKISRTYAVYDEKMREQIIMEHKIGSIMRKALYKREFVMYLQPIYDGRNDELVAAEALVRWINPEHGFMSPGDFIPLFERNGFIVDIDKYMRERVFEFMRKRLRENKRVVPVSVNISRINFYNENFGKEIVEEIKNSGIDRSLIKIELTESAYIENPTQVIGVVDKLRANDIQVLMDDFGTGYSSLNMLREIPVDTLKLDMKFIHNLENSERARSIVASVIEMAKKLRIDVVSEGVETEVQKDFLVNNGCNNIQGYYYSKPIPVEEFEKLL